MSGCWRPTLALVLMLLLAAPAAAFDNGLARTPPMGWNSWYAYRCGVTETGVLDNARALVHSGLKARGYRFVNVDGCWEAASRGPDGRLRSDPVAFPHGMAALGRELHAMGLRFGLYTSAGSTICLHPQPGSYRHYRQDFRTFARWKVDYVKVDWCSSPPHGDQVRAYRAISRAARRSGRKMIVAVSTPGSRLPWRWAAAFGNLWRIGVDASGTWDGVLSALDTDAPLWPYAAPGRWNDPDMLQVGSPALTEVEQRSQFSLWSMLAAPLLEGYDLGRLPESALAILSNREVIAVNQDPAGCQARRVRRKNGIETWVKPLSDGSWGVLFLNRRRSPHWFSVRVGDVPGIKAAELYSVRDLWGKVRVETAAKKAMWIGVEGHGVVMWRVRATTRYSFDEYGSSRSDAP